MTSIQSVKLVPPQVLEGVVQLPGGKSETNRALIISALSESATIIRRAAHCDDTEVVCSALKTLGFQVERKEDDLFVGDQHARKVLGDRILLGSAGTAMRFLTVLCAWLSKTWITLDGSEPLRKRPMSELLDALKSLGAEVECLEKDGFLPYRVRRGQFEKGGLVHISGERSSQFVSGLLLIAPVLEEGLRIQVEGKQVSAPYIDLTLQMMKRCGVKVEQSGKDYVVPKAPYVVEEFQIEPDASSAVYFFGLAAVLGGKVRVLGLSRNTVQADIEILTHLESMGCKVAECEEDVGVEVQGPKELQGISADLSRTPDGALTLACVAAFAKSPSVFSGLSHLPHKESDRLQGLVSELRRIGVNAWCDKDSLSILPGPFRPASVKTFDDHRMAMAFSLCAMGHPGIEIGNPEVVRKSFPGYWDALVELGVQVKFRESPNESDIHRFHG